MLNELVRGPELGPQNEEETEGGEPAAKRCYISIHWTIIVLLAVNSIFDAQYSYYCTIYGYCSLHFLSKQYGEQWK